jgi:predicted nucleic acid-binding protein
VRWVAVFDTNILISALLSLRGNPFRCLTLARIGIVQSVTCQEILDEFQEKLQGKFAYTLQRARAAADEVRKFSQLVSITNSLKVVSTDPDDDKIGTRSQGYEGVANGWLIQERSGCWPWNRLVTASTKTA